MSRRIFTAMIAVTALALVSFGIPLALVAGRLNREDALVRLEGEAVRAGLQVPASFQTTGDPVELPEPQAGTVLALYAPDGRKLMGKGPDRGGAEVARAADGQIVHAVRDGQFVVTVPLSSEETVFAVIRSALAESAVAGSFGRARLLIVLLGMAALAVAALVSRQVARRLSGPVEQLAKAAARLGAGDFTTKVERSGIPELDDAAGNLEATAGHLGRILTRERTFSADASHQLRTPLTSLRLYLETALSGPPDRKDESIVIAIDETDRLERTIDELLALARDTHTDRGPLDVANIVRELEAGWHGTLAAAGRPLKVNLPLGLPRVQASAGAVRQILEVLVGNAFEHGAGIVRVEVRTPPGGVVIDVSDEGQSLGGDLEAIFARRSGISGKQSIGLALARSLAEAEGARLLVRLNEGSPTFSLLLRTEDPKV